MNDIFIVGCIVGVSFGFIIGWITGSLMTIEIEFEIDDLKYSRYQYALDVFLELLYGYKINDNEVSIHED